MATEIKTEHPHIVRVEGVRGGRPVIRGTGITVSLIARYYKMGADPDEVLMMYPFLSPAAVYDALSYYHDHQKEIEEDIAESTLEKTLERNKMKLNERGRIVPIDSGA